MTPSPTAARRKAGRAAKIDTAKRAEYGVAQVHLAAYDRHSLRAAIPGDWMPATWTARRCGIDAEVVVSFGLWVAVEEGRLTLQDVMRALAAAAGAASGLMQNISLHTTPATVASCVGEHDGRPLLAIRLES